MPEVLESFEFRNFGPRGSSEQQDWDTLLDGQIRKLQEGTDFKKKITFLNAARMNCKKRGLRLRTGATEGGVIIQAVPIPPGESADEGTEGANGTQVASEPPKPLPAPNAAKPTVTTTATGQPVAPKPQPAQTPVNKGGPKPAAKK